MEGVMSLPPFLSQQCAIAGVVALGFMAPAGSAEARKPNLVLILSDNLGNGDVGCFGSKLHRTPNLDRMAAEGVKLTGFYSASGVCSPSR